MQIESTTAVSSSTGIKPYTSRSIRHLDELPGNPFILQPCHTKTGLATLGGTFITGGQTGRKGCFAEESEEVREEREFVDDNDPFRARSADELELPYTSSNNDIYDEDRYEED